MKPAIHTTDVRLEGARAWHALTEDQALRLWRSCHEGLTEEEVHLRLRDYGPNALPAPREPTILEIILHQVASPLIVILLVAAGISVLIGELTDAFFILFVIGVNTTLGAYQEYRAQRSASSLQQMLRLQARVRREGRVREIDAEELVPGDIVLLDSGARVPADMRLLSARGLLADESLLTGESIAVEKDTKALAEDVPLADRRNMVYAGSTITAGRGVGVVVATGMHTEVGAIARRVAESETAKPPLVVRMEQFTRNITVFILVVSILLTFILRTQGYAWMSIFFFVVALAVSAIPEGLPVALTVALSVASHRMSRRNVIVRRLTAVESLGSCTVIASDKTGTLTVNQQTVRCILLPDGMHYRVTGEGYNGIGQILQGDVLAETSALSPLMEAVLMANEASLRPLPQGQWEHQGDAMDVALLALLYKAGIAPEQEKKRFKLVEEIPYESENKYSAAFYEKSGELWAAAKGAVETVLSFCGSVWVNGEIVALDCAAIEREANAMAAEGLRVLAVAGGPCLHLRRDQPSASLRGLRFLGLVGFIDPLRPEAKTAVERCREAGIRVLMITGDHPATAEAIARELGLISPSHLYPVVSGSLLKEAADPHAKEFDNLVRNTNVFARVSPEQKLHIVDTLIRQGEFVAVTGDGVNDTPALRRANIGVAMGSGTDAAKETGTMIIVDDNFSSIVAGVEEGRYAYDNVRKVISLLVSTGAAEVFLFLAAVVVQLPAPLLAVQLLWLNLVTNGIQDVSLAFEKGEAGAMRRPPRKPSEPIFNRLMIEQTVVAGIVMSALTLGLWYWLIRIVGMSEAEARNEVLLLFVLMQNVHVFNCRSERTSAFRIPLARNPLLVIGVLAAQGLHIVCMHIPFMQKILRIQPVNWRDWILLLLLALTLLITMELYKSWVRWRERRQSLERPA
ncbi:MAG: HAD-IC family P-type ATPase [Saprospiraceae bacterium]|nr:HAD-IC family P-type ATPase [Saprospiraceae bacterium]MDW8485209.1 HAD-IC family P-type ATPase [Saprospiraceae bacterium]